MTVNTLSWAMEQRAAPLNKLLLIYLAEYSHMDGRMVWDTNQENSAIAFTDTGPAQLGAALRWLHDYNYIRLSFDKTGDIMGVQLLGPTE